MKYISLTQDTITTLVQEFQQHLTGLRSNQDKITFEKNFKDIAKVREEDVKKPIIYFSNDAWTKMNALVQSSDKELAWQATVEKRKFKDKEDSEDFFYYIDQVFVYPQKVTATFVDTDEIEYAEWSLKLPDEVFNKLRFQGHSHVNMAVSPSGTDQNTYQNFLDQLDENDFYIFMILNKRREYTILLYDFAQNIIFETKDCVIDVITRTGGLTRWLETSKQLITEKKYPTTQQWDCPGSIATTPHYTPSWCSCNKGIDWATNTSYKENGVIYAFKNNAEKADFFMAHPEFITENCPDPTTKAIMAKRKMWQEETQPHKKRGRPPKGAK